MSYKWEKGEVTLEPVIVGDQHYPYIVPNDLAEKLKETMAKMMADQLVQHLKPLILDGGDIISGSITADKMSPPNYPKFSDFLKDQPAFSKWGVPKTTLAPTDLTVVLLTSRGVMMQKVQKGELSSFVTFKCMKKMHVFGWRILRPDGTEVPTKTNEHDLEPGQALSIQISVH